MSTKLLFSGWLRLPGCEWKLVIRARSEATTRAIMKSYGTTPGSSKVVLPAGEHPLFPESRWRNSGRRSDDA